MKFLLDQDVYTITLRFLVGLGHDVVTAAEVGFSTAIDSEVLNLARRLDRIFVTRDRDFGGLVFVEDFGSGVIYLRMQLSSTQAVHQELRRVLESYAEDELKGAFIVVEPGRHRFRRLPR